MYKVKNFDDWIIDNRCSTYGSGASEKLWLVNPITNERGLFKFPKIKSDNTTTYEYLSEVLASMIGELININCAKTDIGVYNGRIGVISYNFISDDSRLIEGVNFIQEMFPNYDVEYFNDNIIDIKYNIEMLSKLDINFNDILNMIIFDYLIGNSDRHHSNWGYICNGKKEFAPLYDNGSSLCAYVNESDIDNILRDNLRFNALIDTKSKSQIGYDKETPIRYYKLIEMLYNNYYNETKELVNIIDINITHDNIKNILNKFSNDIISDKRKELLIKYIMVRKEYLVNIYKEGE